jgi:hypothetical protein
MSAPADAALSALVNVGYQRGGAEKALNSILKDGAAKILRSNSLLNLLRKSPDFFDGHGTVSAL